MNPQHNIIPKAVLFDWDNTLVDSLGIVHDALNYTFVQFGLPQWTFEEVQIKIHRSFRNSISSLFPINEQEALKVYRDRYVTLSTDLKPFPMAEEVLSLLKRNKIHTALVSNKTAPILREEVKKLGWDHYFIKIVGSGDLDHDKPEPITVHHALEDSNIVPNQHHVWFIGDSVTDMETAHNAKCVPVFFGSDDHNCERYAHCRPTIHFPDHQKLLDHLKKHMS
jgi:phosphoglycolate phosphatase